MALLACEQDKEPKVNAPEDVIRLTAVMAPESATRSTTQSHLSNNGMQFTSGQPIALFMTEADPTNGSLVSGANVSYDGNLHSLTTGTNGALDFDLGSDCYWPATNNVNFYAWHPYAADGCFAGKKAGETTVFRVNANQSTDEAYKASDLLWARSTNIAKPSIATTAIPLTFYHALSKVKVVLQSSSSLITASQLSTATVLLKGTASAPIYLDATVDIDGATASCLTTGATTTEVQFGTGSTTFAVLPSGQSLSGKVIDVTFADNDGDTGGHFTYTISTLNTIAAAKLYTITLTLKLNSVTVTETVHDWEAGSDDRDNTSNPLYI